MGTLTTNGYFYKPDLGAVGTAELALFHASLDAADAKLAEFDSAVDPHKHTKLWLPNGASVVGLILTDGNIVFNTPTVGDNATKTVALGAGIAPTTFPVDVAQFCVKDQAVGNACFHFFTELGQIIKLYQQAHIADAKVNYTTGDLDSEAEIITAINATNTILNSVLTRLENLGFNALA